MNDERQERLRERMAELDAEKKIEEEQRLPARFQIARLVSTGLFFLGIIVVAIRGVAIWRDYQGWRNAGTDRSAREAYITFLEVDVVLLVLTIAGFIAVGALVTWWVDRDPD